MIGSQRTSTNEGRRLTTAGLIAVTAATLLMMAWAVFPSAAGAAPTPTLVPGNPQCSDLGLLETNGTVITEGNEEAGTQEVRWQSATPVDAVIVKGGPNANVYSYNEATSDTGLKAPINPNTNKPYGVSHVDLCYDETTTTSPPTTTTSPPTTTTSPPTTTTSPPTTTTSPPTTTTSPPTTTTSPPTTTTSSSPTVRPTTVEPTDGPSVAPTTVSPGGTAFTGVENVVPLGAIALMLMTSGSGLLWAGARRRRDNSEDEE